jgi:hypothetical protein
MTRAKGAGSLLCLVDGVLRHLSASRRPTAALWGCEGHEECDLSHFGFARVSWRQQASARRSAL